MSFVLDNSVDSLTLFLAKTAISAINTRVTESRTIFHYADGSGIDCEGLSFDLDRNRNFILCPVTSALALVHSLSRAIALDQKNSLGLPGSPSHLGGLGGLRGLGSSSHVS